MGIKRIGLSKSPRSLFRDVRYLYIEEQSIDYNKAVPGPLSVIVR